MSHHGESINLPRMFAVMVGMVFDIVGSLSLLLYALLLGPLGVLRGPLVLEMAFWYLWVLLPQRLLARAVRVAVDWRLGRFDTAISQAEGIIASCEEHLRRSPKSQSRRRVLEDLYTLLARAYMHAGHVDDAMLVIIRAKKTLGIERLSGLAELDAKTAHLVRAGLAAGRLLDGQGLATMFVKSNQPESQPKTSSARPSTLKGATKSPIKPEGQIEPVTTSSSQGGSRSRARTVHGNVIPFPGSQTDTRL